MGRLISAVCRVLRGAALNLKVAWVTSLEVQNPVISISNPFAGPDDGQEIAGRPKQSFRPQTAWRVLETARRRRGG